MNPDLRLVTSRDMKVEGGVTVSTTVTVTSETSTLSWALVDEEDAAPGAPTNPSFGVGIEEGVLLAFKTPVPMGTPMKPGGTLELSIPEPLPMLGFATPEIDALRVTVRIPELGSGFGVYRPLSMPGGGASPEFVRFVGAATPPGAVSPSCLSGAVAGDVELDGPCAQFP